MIFGARVTSTNTKRRFGGETFYQSDRKNPLVQRIHLADSWREYYVLEVEFTEQEFNAPNTFCSGITKLVNRK